MALVHEKLKLVAQIVYTVYISPAFMTLWKVELEREHTRSDYRSEVIVAVL